MAELADAVTDPRELRALLGLGSGPDPDPCGFRFKVPRSYIARMQPGNAEDPLLLQVWPGVAEALKDPRFGPDPVGDGAARCGPGVLQKYAGRALLTVTGACALHCRYCFRRHFPYASENPLGAAWPATLAQLRAMPDLDEVILSGGDPLVLGDHRLAQVVGDLEQLPALHRLRIHTRLPVVLPSRVDAALCAWIAATRLQVVVVVHANHAQEIDSSVQQACRALAGAGATLLNQSVLLRGINDTLPALTQLSARLFAAGVLPYYLHLLDRVAGAAHFEVPEDRARTLYGQLCAALPGYLVPRLVRETPGAAAKTLVLPA